MPHSKLYPATNPIATLLIVHGMTEHQSMYADFAQFLADNGIAAMTFDHLGHGQEAYENHTLGYMGNPNPTQLMIDKVMGYAHELKNHYPSLPHLRAFKTLCQGN